MGAEPLGLGEEEGMVERYFMPDPIENLGEGFFADRWHDCGYIVWRFTVRCEIGFSPNT